MPEEELPAEDVTSHEDDAQEIPTAKGLVYRSTDILANNPGVPAEIAMSNELVGGNVREIQQWIAKGLYEVREGDWPGKAAFIERIQNDLNLDESQAVRLLELAISDLGTGMDDPNRLRRIAILQKQALLAELTKAMFTPTVEQTYQYVDDPENPNGPRIMKPFKVKTTGGPVGAQHWINPVIANMIRDVQNDIIELQQLHEKQKDTGPGSMEELKELIIKFSESHSSGEGGKRTTRAKLTMKQGKSGRSRPLDSPAAKKVLDRYIQDVKASRQVESRIVDPPIDSSKPE